MIKKLPDFSVEEFCPQPASSGLRPLWPFPRSAPISDRRPCAEKVVGDRCSVELACGQISVIETSREITLVS